IKKRLFSVSYIIEPIAAATMPPTVTRSIKITTTIVNFSNSVFLRGPFSPNATITYLAHLLYTYYHNIKAANNQITTTIPHQILLKKPLLQHLSDAILPMLTRYPIVKVPC